MPVPQTLAKKLNKDVFQGERERERERQREYWEALGTHLRHSPGQRRGKDRRLRKKRKKKKPSIKSDKSKSASSTAALGKRAGKNRQRRGWTAKGKEMDISWLSVSEQCFYEWLPSYQSSIIRQLNTCCLQMLNKIKLSHNDLRVHIPLLLYNQSFARLDTYYVQFFFLSLNEAICF